MDIEDIVLKKSWENSLKGSLKKAWSEAHNGLYEELLEDPFYEELWDQILIKACNEIQKEILKEWREDVLKEPWGELWKKSWKEILKESEEKMFISYLKDANDKSITVAKFNDKWRDYETSQGLVIRYKGKKQKGKKQECVVELLNN